MRKYFLLSAVALIISSTANAATDAAVNLSASATIYMPTLIECTEIEFGDLYIKKYSNSSTEGDTFGVIMSSDGSIDNIESHWGLIGSHMGTPGSCTLNGETFSYTATIDYDSKILLNNDDNSFVNNLKMSSGGIITGQLTILDVTQLQSGTKLSGNAAISFTYE